VEGTRRLLELAARCDARGGLRRFSYVSTAYVAGTHRGDFGEDDLDVGQGFRNAYERSKWEAERLVRSRSGALPIQVFRPSIVVGEEETGWTTSFNVIYGPLRGFARGAYPVLPARRSAPVDVVPVSFVADAIFELSTQPSGEGRTYHLAAGRRASSVGEVIAHSARYFQRKPPVVVPPSVYRRLVHPLVLRRAGPAQRRWLERSEVLFPYFAMGMRFDISRTEDALDPAGIRAAPLASYLDRLLDFAVAADWGRNPVTRPELVREHAALAVAA
jgi:long-chain acyl-CoA synthetase